MVEGEKTIMKIEICIKTEKEEEEEKEKEKEKDIRAMFRMVQTNLLNN